MVTGEISQNDIRQPAYNADRQRSLLVGFENQTALQPADELSALTTEFRQRLFERAFAHKRELEHRTYHDALTGLPNILLVRDRLEYALSMANRKDEIVVVASIGVDNFKNINAKFSEILNRP